MCNLAFSAPVQSTVPIGCCCPPGSRLGPSLNPNGLDPMQVLVVDDDPAILRLLSKVLSSAGYQVQQAADGISALEAIGRDCPYFLITDWDMPGITGLELCRRVRQLDLPHYVHTLMLTARSCNADAIAGLEAGADDFVIKPVRPEELLARLRAGARIIDLERRLVESARTDPLTGLPLKRTLHEQLERHLARAQRHGLPLTCAMMDLDYFKRVNDEFGHAAGDEVLRAVGQKLACNTRQSDYACRYGGEEFCILLTQMDEDRAWEWAERLRAELAELPIVIQGRPLRITASLGVAQRRDDTCTPEQLVDLADQALLVAKRSGRNRVTRFSSLDENGILPLTESWQARDPFKGLLARHAMAPAVICLRETDTLEQAAEYFLNSRVNSVPVVDADGKLAGMVSERDLIAEMLTPGARCRLVSEIMTAETVCFDEDTPLRTIYDFLCRVTLHRVVIVRDRWPRGVITRSCLLRLFNNWLTAGQPSGQGPLSSKPIDCSTARQWLRETTVALSEQAARTQRYCEGPDADLVPGIVAAAAGLQELINDLLTYSSAAHGSLYTTAARMADAGGGQGE
ncbi:MAG: diguanylate cyclase [Planctomycetes bacterium]|nr:diguanylate cyclase [Planctomycetota bacterium]